MVPDDYEPPEDEQERMENEQLMTTLFQQVCLQLRSHEATFVEQ